MEKEREICEYRDKLDKTLSSPELTNHETLKSLLRNQLSSSSQECNENILEKRTTDVSKLLSKLRSVSMTDHQVSKSTNYGDWKLKHDHEDCRVMYREGLDGSPFHTMLVEGYMDGPIPDCLCVSWESTLYKKWWPQFSFPPFRILESTCLQKIGIGEQISLVRKDEDSIGVSSKDIIPESPDVVRMNIEGGFVLQKVTPERSYFRTIGDIDIKLDLIPPSLMNFISRQLIGNGFRLYKKSVASVAKFDEDYSRALADDPLYTKIRRALYSTDKAIEEEPKSQVKEADVESLPKNNGYASENGRVVTEIEEEVEEDGDFEDSVSSDDENVISKTHVDMRRRFCISPEVEQALGTLERVIYMVRNIPPVQEAEELSPNRVAEDQAKQVSLLENIQTVPQRSEKQDFSITSDLSQAEKVEKETGDKHGILNNGEKKNSSLRRKRKPSCFAFKSWR